MSTKKDKSNNKYINRIKNELDNISDSINVIYDTIPCVECDNIHMEMTMGDIKKYLDKIRVAIEYKWDI